jgi:hypothetical protein
MPSSSSGRIEVSAIVGALTPKELQRHKGKGLCYKCHKKGPRVVPCPQRKEKEHVDISNK